MSDRRGRHSGRTPIRDCEEWGMRAFWSRKNDEDEERYRQRTVGRIRGLATPSPDADPAETDRIRARIERMTREIDRTPDAAGNSA
jgi:hypothetical protein